jgi:hypothetical protein
MRGPMPSGLKPGEIDATRYPELRKWVVGCLSNHKKPNDIIFELCRRTGWDWNQAKRFIAQVVDLDQKRVHQKRMPLLLAIGLVFFFLPAAIAFISAYGDLKYIFSTLKPPWDLQTFRDAALLSLVNYPLLGKLAGGVIGVISGSFGILNIMKPAITGEGEDLMNPPPPPPLK